MAFRKIITGDKNLQLVQDAVDSALRQLIKSPLAGVHLVKDVTLTSGQDNLVAHGLGRAPQIFLIASVDADTRVWTQASTQLSNQNASDTWINLRTTNTCTVNLIFSKGI